jgi:hypothetical protein
MPHLRTLPDLLTIAASGGTLVGGAIGCLLPAKSLRRTIENLTLGVAAGAFAGAYLGFLAYVVALAVGA